MNPHHPSTTTTTHRKSSLPTTFQHLDHHSIGLVEHEHVRSTKVTLEIPSHSPETPISSRLVQELLEPTNDSQITELERDEVQKDLHCFMNMEAPVESKKRLYEGLIVMYPKSKKIIQEVMEKDLAQSLTSKFTKKHQSV